MLASAVRGVRALDLLWRFLLRALSPQEVGVVPGEPGVECLSPIRLRDLEFAADRLGGDFHFAKGKHSRRL